MPATPTARITDRTETSDLAASLMEKVFTRWRQGQTIFREAALLRETLALKMVGDLRPSWFSDFVYLGPPPLRGDVNSAVMAWVAQRLRSMSASANWFRPSEGLLYSLCATDLRGACVADLHMPFPAFYVELPADFAQLHDATTGWHPVRILTVAEGEMTAATHAAARLGGSTEEDLQRVPLGRRLLFELYAEPNGNSRNPFDDAYIFKSYRLADPTSSLDVVVHDHDRDNLQHERATQRGRLGERELDGLELRELLLRFVLNFCVYIGEHGFRHVHDAEVRRLRTGQHKDRKTTKQRINRLRSERVFEVGTDVVIEPELREYVRTEGTARFRLQYRVLVRGHWRNQACGPQYSERKRTWIRPHVRGADLATPTVGHNYEVR